MTVPDGSHCSSTLRRAPGVEDLWYATFYASWLLELPVPVHPFPQIYSLSVREMPYNPSSLHVFLAREAKSLLRKSTRFIRAANNNEVEIARCFTPQNTYCSISILKSTVRENLLIIE